MIAEASAFVLGVREVVRGDSLLLLEIWLADSVADSAALLDGWPLVVRELTEVADEDWMAGARAQAQPFEVGTRFVLDPREPDPELKMVGDADRFRLRLPARRAFGTGTHETTQLMVRALETVGCESDRVLDVGCGTGVLSFVALRLGARSCFGFDIDLASAFVGRENCRLNGFEPSVSPSFFAGDSSSMMSGATFDLVLVNVLPERIAGSEAALAAAVGSGGRLLLAGQLANQEDKLLPRWTRFGLKAGRRLAQGEWTLTELVRS